MNCNSHTASDRGQSKPSGPKELLTEIDAALEAVDRCRGLLPAQRRGLARYVTPKTQREKTRAKIHRNLVLAAIELQMAKAIVGFLK